jgi:hypothetical protein
MWELDVSPVAWGGICYALVSPLAIAGGTALVGNAMGGQGRFSATILGAGLGSGAAVLATALAGASEDRDTTELTAGLTFGVFPIVGALLGYALDSASQSSGSGLLARTPSNGEGSASSGAASHLVALGGALVGAAITGGLCTAIALSSEPRRYEAPSGPTTNGYTYESYNTNYSGYRSSNAVELDWYEWDALCYAMASPFAIAASATLGGYAMGSDGRYWASVGGAGLGVAAAALATLIAASASDGDKDLTHGTAIASFALLPVVGATLFHTLSVTPLATVIDQGRGVSLGARLVF